MSSGSWLIVIRLSCAVLTMLGGLLGTSAAMAHDVPADVRISAFLRPSGAKAELLLRVPLGAMQEVDVPTYGPGYLAVSRAQDALRHAAKLWLVDNIDLYADGARLGPPSIAAVRVSLPSDRSFTSFEAARAHMADPPLADDLELYWNQQLMDVLLEYPLPAERAEFAIRLRVDRLGDQVVTALRFIAPEEATRAFEFHGDPGLVQLDPRWHQAAKTFLVAGFWHILGGIDHLLFLVCLVVPFRRLRPLAIIVTSFTLAHSIALAAAALDFVPDALWFPPLVEAMIAATIVYMALENIVGSNVQARWILAFAFGIVHGFGFSFLLRDSLQFAGDHLLTSLVAFNLGVEIGQLAVLLVLVPALDRAFRYVPERIGVIILMAFVAHTGWHWMLERGESLLRFPFPTLDAAFLATVMRGLMAALVLTAALMAINGVLRRWLDPGSDRESKDARHSAPPP